MMALFIGVSDKPTMDRPSRKRLSKGTRPMKRPLRNEEEIGGGVSAREIVKERAAL